MQEEWRSFIYMRNIYYVIFPYMINIKGIELRHLRYFVTVAEQMSFSRAAEQLHMAQPPLSQQIKDLETRIGVPLFIRDKRRVLLSEAGRMLLPDAQAVIAAAQQAVTRAYRAGQGLAGHLRVGMMNTAPHNPQILSILQRFGAQYRDVTVEPVMLATRQQHSALLADEIDLAFHWPWDGVAKGLQTVTLCTYRFCLAVAPHHAYAKSRKRDFGQLVGENWYAVGGQYNRAWHDFTRQYLDKAGLAHVGLIERNPALFGLVLPIAAGQGVGLLPDFLAPITPQVSFLPLPALRGVRNELPLCLSIRRARGQGAAASFFALARGLLAKSAD